MTSLASNDSDPQVSTESSENGDIKTNVDKQL